MALSAEGERRLGEFIEWVFLSGVEEERLPDFRRIATELFELASGGRVNESHILRLIDARSEGPSGKAAVSLIEDVGEQILRFQAARKSNPSLTPVPMAAAPTRPLRSSASQPFVARPEERVAGELRPPVAVTAESDTPGSVVSFATGSAPPPPPGLSTPPVGPSSPSTLPVSPSAPQGLLALAQHSPPVTDKATRRSATLFRCRRCKSMVESDPSGACPRCGTPAPRVASAPMPVIGTSSRNWLVGVGAVLTVGVVGVLFVPRLIERIHHPSTPVAGEYRSSHLGVRLLFPDATADGAASPGGWRHLREGDRAPTASLGPLGDLVGEPLSLRSARFFRGSVGNPDAELYFVVGSRAAALSEAALGTWAQSVAETPDKVADPIRELTGVANVHFFQCASGAGVPHGGLRCTGTASHTAAILTIWTARNDIDLALFLSSAGPEPALAESTDVVAGLDTGP